LKKEGTLGERRRAPFLSGEELVPGVEFRHCRYIETTQPKGRLALILQKKRFKLA
jgi:hypothetical protein